MTWIRMALISLMTGYGLGFGFWSAHLFCKMWYSRINAQKKP